MDTIRTSLPVWLYGLVVFVAAWLVFWVQPLAVVLARDEAALRLLDLDDGWLPLAPPDRIRAWTDDYTSIAPLLRWF